MRERIIFFTRLPEMGSGKTRLAKFLSEDERFDLITKLFTRTLREIEATRVSYSIHYSGNKEEIRFFGIPTHEQEGEDLGEKMHRSLVHELRSYSKVVLIGSDLANISADYIKTAFEALDTKDLVLGPSLDGGYGLIAMKEDLDVFTGITYSRPDVLEKTIDKLGPTKSYQILSPLRDIDEPIDLVREEIRPEEIELLGYGEYNLNYKYKKGVQTGVFRVNLGSQMDLGEDQIPYEYGALKALEASGVTPKPYKKVKKGAWVPRPYLTMEYLEGRPLDYDRDMEIAAYILSTIHSQPTENTGLIQATRPFEKMYEEFEAMFSHYRAWDKKDEEVEGWIQRLLAIAESLGLSDGIKTPSIINTELNNRNFIIGETKESSYLIDWEKPLIGDAEQDLAHFTVPTTTKWKTDKVLTREEVDSFLDLYEAYRPLDRKLFDKYYIFNCLRGISWSSMARVEYDGARALSNDETLEKIKLFTSVDFIDFIYQNFYKEYDID